MPHNRFWIASATEKTSRPQWCSCDSGVRKKPSEERGPKLTMAIRQPQTTTTKGVRQPIVSAAFPAAPGNDIAARLRRPITLRAGGRGP